MEEYRAKLELLIPEIDSLDDLIESYLEGEDVQLVHRSDRGSDFSKPRDKQISLKEQPAWQYKRILSPFRAQLSEGD